MDYSFRWLCILLYGLCICSIADIWSGTHYGVAAIGRTDNGPGKPQNCSAVALSSTSVQLTWNAPLGNGKLVKGYWIHYRPLYSKDEFLKFPVGSQFDHVVEDLDVITYYAFRIVVKDFAGNHDYCEVLAKTWRDASLAVPIRVSRGNETALIATWRAVNLQNVLVKYRLFMEWESRGVIHVRLLYEGPQTRCVVSGERLSFPYRMYVSVIVGRVFNFTVQAAYKPKYQPLKTALIPETTINDEPINVFIDDYGWNFVNLSWNALKTGNSHVIFTVTYKTGSTVKTEVTSKSTALLSGLEQLTSYRIKVKAVIDGGNLEISSTEVMLTTLERNECAEIEDTCSNRSECVNTRGSYFCRCPLGWTGDGKACKELPDENANLVACDSHVYINITWQRTLQGQIALAQCPLGTRGVAKRECLETSSGLPRWGVPDLSDCVSDRMANIAQQLEDPNADLSEVAEQLVNATELDPHAQTPLQTGDLKVVIDVIEIISQKGLRDVPNELPSVRDEKIRKITQAVVKSSSNILDSTSLETWKFMPKDSRASEASKLLKSVDTIALYLAKTGNQSEGVVSEAPNVVLSAISTDDAAPTDQRMPATAKTMRNVSSSSVVLPGSVLMLQRNKYNQSGVQYITFVSYRNLNALMQPDTDKTSSASKGENDEDRIESEVVSVSISPMEVNIFQEPVTLILRNSQQDEHKGEASCVYWNMSSVRGVWDETGCQLKEQNSSHTVCECYHLTSFAVLMRVRDIPESEAMEKHKFALSLLSYIGLSVSVVALCICFLTFSCLRFRNMRHRYFVHANLALSLGLADTLFLFGINKTGNEVICKTIAITLHYLFLASFCWMALEGVILYLMLVKIFNTKSKPGRDKAFFFLGGWGVPAVVVAVCAGLFHEGYGTESFCWLTLENNFTWAFVAPVVLVCLFNGICLGKTFLVMSNSRKETQSDTRIQKIRYWSRGCALLSCLLGLTWILGVFVVNEDTIFMAYLFNIFNSLQGLLIFLFHCIGDEKVRAEYLRIIRCQARTKAYETARPWWSKSDSMSRSRAWEDKNERHRRSTLSTNNSSKTTTDRPVSGRPNSANVQGNALLQGSLDRPLEMRLLYGTTEDDHMQEKEIEQAEIQREEEDESGTVEENQPITLEPNPDEEPNAAVQNDETNEEDSSQPNLPDEVRNKDSDEESVV